MTNYKNYNQTQVWRVGDTPKITKNKNKFVRNLYMKEPFKHLKTLLLSYKDNTITDMIN